MADILRHKRQCRHQFVVCRSCFGIFGNWQQLFDHKVKYRLLDDKWTGIRFPHRSDHNAIHQCDHPKCHQHFPDLRTLTRHQRLHSKPFQCTALIGNGVICGKRFANKRNLTVHVRSHCDDRREKCSFCGLTFCDPSTLRKHVRNTHVEVVPKAFSCRICLKQFAQKHALQQHFATHSLGGSRQLFGCDSCQMTFTVKSNKDRHDRKYHAISDAKLDGVQDSDANVNDNLFRCIPCGKSWSRKSDKARHDRYHHGSDSKNGMKFKDIWCHICDKTFAQKSGKTRHDKMFHAVDCHPDNCDSLPS